MFSCSEFDMAPIEQDSDPKNGKITNIADLDSASTCSRAEYLRSPSYNNTLVYREAKCKANIIKENDDLISSEAAKTQKKPNPKNVWEDDDVYDIYPGTDISCLDVDRDPKAFEAKAISGLKSLHQTPETTLRLKTWKSSSGKGKKRKKKGKRKNTKRQKTNASTSESLQTLDYMSCSDSEVSSADDADDVKVMTKNTNKMKNCTITAGDGKSKTGTKGGCVNTQRACGTASGNKKAYYSPAEQHGGGGAGGGGAGGGGDDGDDERGKPPRKPPEHTAGSKSSKIKKKAKTPNNEEPEQAPLPEKSEVKPNCLLEMRGKLNSDIIHSNFCKVEQCGRCQMIQTMVTHYFDEMNGACRCKHCLLFLCVLKYHRGVCHFQDCKVCKRVRGMTVKPTARATVVQREALNVPTCGPSLDQDDRIIWRNESFPQDLTHFKEHTDYILSPTHLEKGGHGAIFNIDVIDAMKKKCFSSDCEDLVVKVCKEKVGEDEMYLLDQTSKHPNFVGTYCVIQKTHPERENRIIMEKCEMSLKHHLRNLAAKGKTMDIYESMFYWTQVLDAIKYLHYLPTTAKHKIPIPVIHKDIKGENVLLSIKENFLRVKLADYDAVKRLHHEFTRPGLTIKGTPGFISPEVLRQQPHGRPADIWNMGMFLLQLLFVKDFCAYQGRLNALRDVCGILTEMQSFVNEKLSKLRDMDTELANLIQLCLDEEPSSRPTAVEILNHPAVIEYTRMEIDMHELIRQISQA